MATQIVSFRIGGTPDEEEALAVFQTWLGAGWGSRHIMTQALRQLGGYNKSEKIMVSIVELHQLVLELTDKIAAAPESAMIGSPVSMEPNIELDVDLLANMRSSHREGKEL